MTKNEQELPPAESAEAVLAGYLSAAYIAFKLSVGLTYAHNAYVKNKERGAYWFSLARQVIRHMNQGMDQIVDPKKRKHDHLSREQVFELLTERVEQFSSGAHDPSEHINQSSLTLPNGKLIVVLMMGEKVWKDIEPLIDQNSEKVYPN